MKLQETEDGLRFDLEDYKAFRRAGLNKRQAEVLASFLQPPRPGSFEEFVMNKYYKALEEKP